MGVLTCVAGGMGVFKGEGCGVSVGIGVASGLVGGICRKGAAVAPSLIKGSAANPTRNIAAPSMEMRARDIILVTPLLKVGVSYDALFQKVGGPAK